MAKIYINYNYFQLRFSSINKLSIILFHCSRSPSSPTYIQQPNQFTYLGHVLHLNPLKSIMLVVVSSHLLAQLPFTFFPLLFSSTRPFLSSFSLWLGLRLFSPPRFPSSIPILSNITSSVCPSRFCVLVPVLLC